MSQSKVHETGRLPEFFNLNFPSSTRGQWVVLSILLALASIVGVLMPVRRPSNVGGPVDAGDTAWMLTATALVLLMTPGLSFFYGGMVRDKNVISTMLQSFISMGVISLLWIVVGFSLAFGDSLGGIIGNPRTFFMFSRVGGAMVFGRRKDYQPGSAHAPANIPFVLLGTGIRHAPRGSLKVIIGGIESPLLYAGAQGSFAGLGQINTRVPAGISGIVDLVVTENGKPANAVKVKVMSSDHAPWHPWPSILLG